MSHEEIMNDIQSPQENKRLDLVNVVRCKDCKYFVQLTEDFDYNFCDAWAGGTNEDMFCGFAERRQDADSSGNMSGTQKELKCTETHSCDCERTETHDLVSRRAAIDSVCEVCENCEYFYNEKLIQTIKDLPSAQPRWIPVTEALPKNGHYYLKCTKYGNVDVDYYWDGFENATKYGEEIVAWMEKPKPYKGGQDGTA